MIGVCGHKEIHGLSRDTSGEKRSLPDDQCLPELKEFLGRTARMPGEKCLDFEVAAALLLYAGPRSGEESLRLA